MQKEKKAWVISVIMGLGHMRAAYPLKDSAHEGIILDGSPDFCKPEEYKIWRRLRNLYYLFSRAEKIPFIGKYIFNLLLYSEKIPSFYPKRDLSKPNWAAHYLHKLIHKKNLSTCVINKIKNKNLPIINTYFASAIAIDEFKINTRTNYLMICDTDINRVWVPVHPQKSHIKYLAPCSTVKQRLLSYGVPEKNIFLTGFPLPKENIGSESKLEILKEDLFHRLLRLDPTNKFFNFHRKSVFYHLQKSALPKKRDNFFVLTLAIGGAGAQVDLVKTILKSLKEKIIRNEIKINISLGHSKSIYKNMIRFLKYIKLSHLLDQKINIIYDEDIFHYYDQFNKKLRETDILWTKPSELSFYCGLGIPILMAPTIGSHEERNRRWLQEIHAQVEPVGALEYIHEWLFDLRDNGRLAEAAWDGFLKARKLGTFKIEKLAQTGKFDPSHSELV